MTMTDETTTDDNDDAITSDDDDDDDDDTDPYTLLTLACEHDRVDIIQSLLECHPYLLSLSCSSNITSNNLVVPLLPALHIAVANGSVRAVNCFLRLGADPSVVFDYNSSNYCDKSSSDAKYASWQKYHNKTAYDIAFGKKAVNLAPGKLEGMRHAFEAEALRAIGSDEVQRVFQLLISGLPKGTVVGDMTLVEWAKTLNGLDCRRLLMIQEVDFYRCELRLEEVMSLAVDELLSSSVDKDVDEHQEENSQPRSSGVVHTSVSIEQVLEENEALAQMLSESLDELTAEVSMSNRFLLAGGTALLEQVRKLKAKKAQLEIELNHYQCKWIESEEELQYLQRCFPNLVNDKNIDNEEKISKSEKTEGIEVGEEEEKKRRIIGEALLKASQDKVRKLRACISDLAEENTRNLAEIDRLGRFGTVNFARKLHGEVRDVEFSVYNTKANGAKCKSELLAFQDKIQEFQPKQKKSSIDKAIDLSDDDNFQDKSIGSSSQRILSGQSRAITQHTERTAFGSYDFWLDLFYRIFGLGKKAIKRANPLNSGKAILV